VNKPLFNELIKGVLEAGKVKRGEKRASRVFKYSPFDVKNLREKLGLSQNEFSRILLVSVKTLQNWEQGRRHPRGPALALLTILKNDPKHAISALG
jgi:putative transcriptional regulator